MLVARIFRAIKAEEYENELFLWEKDSDVNFCRRQQHCLHQFEEFSAFRRRHHCRYCGGVKSFSSPKILVVSL
jgi:hypothetical protein